MTDQTPIVSTHRGRQVVLGRRRVSPHVLGIARVKATELLDSFPKAADARDWIDAAAKQCNGEFGAMLNDSLGCHDSKTEVLTDKGWRFWPEYDGSALATMNQATGILEYQAPRSIIRADYEGPLYFSDHSSLDFALTPNHRMLNRPYVIPHPYVAGTSGYGASRFDEIRNLDHRSAIPGTTTGYVGARFEGITIGDRTWSGDDFFALLGLIVSDGWAGSTESNRHAVSFCSFVESRREMVAGFAHRLGIQELPGRRGVWKFSDAALGEWLRANACDGGDFHSIHKRIPRIVQVASSTQIGHFLTFFGDKNHGDNADEQYFTSSVGMADDLQELLLKAGKRTSLSWREARGNSSPACTLHVRTTEREISIIARGKKAQIATESYQGEVFCAEVPNSTLITRRNGKILISGNSCTISDGPGHCTQVWTANNGPMVTPPDSAILKAYETVDGYDPADPSTDQGGVESEVVAAWQKGIDGFAKLDLYVTISPTNLEHVLTGIERYGCVYSGVALPLSAQDEAVWQLDMTDPAKAEPGSWGGHAITWSKYSRTQKQLACLTWGMEQGASLDWQGAYCDEARALLCSTLWCPNGKSPLGDLVATLAGNIPGLAS